MRSNERDDGGPLLSRRIGVVLVLARGTGAGICDPQGNSALVAHVGDTERALGELDVVDSVGLAGKEHYGGHTDIARSHQLVRIVLLPAPQGRESGCRAL